MDKKLKNCYKLMDLPYNATAEEISSKAEVLIKLCVSDANAKNKDFSKKINHLEKAEKLMLENIKDNGIPNEKEPTFNTSWQSIFNLIIILCFVSTICFASFYILI